MPAVPKIKRIKNPALILEISKLPCVIDDGCFGRVVAHHVVHQGSGGDDVCDNLCPLCVKHHVPEVHKHGNYWMCKTYPRYKQWLKDHNQMRILEKVAKLEHEYMEKLQTR